MTPLNILLLALGGAGGALLRALVSVSLAPEKFPFATLAVNVMGSLLLGFVFGLERLGMMLDPQVRLLVAVGFCGSFTTFSTFSFQTFVLFEEGRTASALANIGFNLVLTLAAIYVGLRLGRLVHPG